MILELGTNKIIDGSKTIVIRGHEIFQLRSGPNDQQLLVDIDVHAEDGSRIAKIAKNQAVHIATGHKLETRPKSVTITRPDGTLAASVEIKGSDRISVLGTFWWGGVCIDITPKYMLMGGNTFIGMVLKGNGTAVSIE